MKMKLEEMLTGIDFDVDVYDDYSDDLGIAFCPPTCLTKTGRKLYEDILDLDVVVNRQCCTALVLIDDKENCEYLHKELKSFFRSIAGFCAVDDWNEWFYYPDEDESYEDDVSEVGYNPYLGCIDDDC